MITEFIRVNLVTHLILISIFMFGLIAIRKARVMCDNDIMLFLNSLLGIAGLFMLLFELFLSFSFHRDLGLSKFYNVSIEEIQGLSGHRRSILEDYMTKELINRL